MIKKHNLIDKNDFNDNIKYALEEFPIDGYISIKVLKLLYNLFSWYYLDGDIEEAFEKSEEASKLKRIIKKFNLESFRGDSLFYSSILLYNTLIKIINLRSFEALGEIEEIENKYENKQFIEKDFTFKALYDVYKQSEFDIPKDILLFSSIFTYNTKKEISNIKHYSQIFNSVSKVDIVKPDLKAKLATKSLRVNYDIDTESSEDRKLIIIQDCTSSMKKHEDKLKVLKAYVLETALKNDYKIDWYFGHSGIQEKVEYSKDNINDVDIKLIFAGIKFNIIDILNDNDFSKDRLLLITDGEDSFVAPFRLNIKELNLISFSENYRLKANIMRYGKFFKF